jgi:F-type H+-transporting ATPase subunit b
MPQLDFTTFPSQIFWLAVSFLVLWAIMHRIAIPTIRGVLQNRQTRISEDLSKAEKLKEEAESAEADFTSVIVNARSKASATLSNVREEAAKESDKRHQKLDETFARQAKESEHRVEVIKNEAIEQMSPITVEVTQEILKKLINVNVDKSKVEKAVASVAKNN